MKLDSQKGRRRRHLRSDRGCHRDLRGSFVLAGDVSEQATESDADGGVVVHARHHSGSPSQTRGIDAGLVGRVGRDGLERGAIDAVAEPRRSHLVGCSEGIVRAESECAEHRGADMRPGGDGYQAPERARKEPRRSLIVAARSRAWVYSRVSSSRTLLEARKRNSEVQR